MNDAPPREGDVSPATVSRIEPYIEARRVVVIEGP